MPWTTLSQRPPGMVGTSLARFDEHRATSEHVASAKHQRGEIVEGAAVIVAVVDLKGADH